MKELTTVTPLSKIITLIMFIVFPFIGFLLGIRYQEMVDLIERQELYNSLISITRSPTPTPEKTTQTTDTSTWKTYTNKKYKFSMQYPNKWDYDEDENQSLINFDIPSNKVSAGNGKFRLAGAVRLDIYDNQNITIDEYVKKNYTSAIKAEDKTTESLLIKEVNHKDCIINKDCINIIVKINNLILDLYSPVWKNRYENRGIMYNMLSTFKPTK